MTARLTIAGLILACGGSIAAGYTNFESSHVHPIALTPSGARLLVVNTPDARLEVYDVAGDGSLTHAASIATGMEPVTVAARSETEAWVVNNLSDSISIINLTTGVTTDTLDTADEPTDVVFAGTRAFVAISQEDAVDVYDVGNLSAAPQRVDLFSRDIRALAVSGDGTKVYAVALRSGNGTAVVHPSVVFRNESDMSPTRLAAMGLKEPICDSPGPSLYPALPTGIVRNPALTDPEDGLPKVGLIVGWNDVTGKFEDDAGQDWTHCLHFRLPDHDLFVIDASSLAVTPVAGLGTNLFDVSVHPQNGKIYVPNTDAHNRVRFEHPLGVRGHIVDNLLSVVDPASGNSVNRINLNSHIVRTTQPPANLVERLASISQPGMMAWKSDGSAAYLTALGSHKVFRVDGACTTDACIVGATRSVPDAVAVGEGPTGIALHEGHDRLYVLSRISHSITQVQASTMTALGEIPLHDPSDQTVRDGRRFLYDAVETSQHGDAACSTCHLSGDLDGLSWDLGDPTGSFVPYTAVNDNVRFVEPVNGVPEECDAALPPDGCASHLGFDPQKGPMTTQTLRGMLEPLHWRGDRSTMRAFNGAFVGLLGSEDIGPGPIVAGLTPQEMNDFRDFALGIQFPPNPHREVNDSLPIGDVQPHGALFAGEPVQGELIFNTFPVDGTTPEPCVACHAHPFGAGGGTLGGVEPAEPTPTTTAALFNGAVVVSGHSDMKVAHLRNMYEKFGPVLGDPGQPAADAKVAFGHTHEGAISDMYRFLSSPRFNLSDANQAEEVRDVVSFLFHFPTGTRPAVGQHVTVPAGAPPTGSTEEEDLLTLLLSLGDVADGNRHCELTATTIESGRLRAWHLDGGVWVTDVAGEPAVTTTNLRTSASTPVSFVCATLGAGPRMGGNRDGDIELDGDDCSPADSGAWGVPVEVSGVSASKMSPLLTWDDQSASAGSGTRYDLVGGLLSLVQANGLDDAECVAADVLSANFDDNRADPNNGDGYWYLVRARNSCATATYGTGRSSLDSVACP